MMENVLHMLLNAHSSNTQKPFKQGNQGIPAFDLLGNLSSRYTLETETYTLITE